MTDLQKATIQAIVNIFESGRIRGNYGAIAVMKGDTGHLSYGRSQTTLGSGGLCTLLQKYCETPGAQFASAFAPHIPRFRQKDLTLDTDAAVRDILKQAGSDPVMQAVQDEFFDEGYYQPAARAAMNVGVRSALAQTVIYDSHIQGGWGIVRGRIPTLMEVGSEQAWIERYVDARKQWLREGAPPLPTTVYRMEAFADLMTSDNWQLTLPITVRGMELREEILLGNATLAPVRRTLSLTDPVMRGDDVMALQRKLNDRGPEFQNTPDGVFGPFTDALVKRFQMQKGILGESGVGPLTRGALGLSFP